MRKALVWWVLLALVLPAVPIVLPQPVAAMTGSGTVGDPYMIYNATDLQNISLDKTAYYELANDINATITSTWNGGQGFVPISPFTGHLNGNFYTIDGLYINRGGGYQALFGQMTAGEVVNVRMTDFSVTSSGASYVSGLVAYITGGTISQCLVGGNATGKQAVGCLVGQANGNSATISECASYGRAYGTIGVGGLMGNTGGATHPIIEDCYSLATVTGWGSFPDITQDIGGLIGAIASTTHPVNCYSAGQVTAGGWQVGSSVGGFVGAKGSSAYCTACFWDEQTSGQSTSPCGTGKFTWEMKTQSTFENAGWDFDTIWGMDAALNGGYAYLLWTFDITQVVWFQPIDIIHGTTLPNRAGYEDGVIVWGGNPSGVLVEHGIWAPEDEYEFDIITPGGQDIIIPTTPATVDVDIVRLRGNPFYPLVQILTIGGMLTERLAWLLLAWLIVIGAMFLVHIGPDTHRGSKKPHHFVLTTITGLGLTILFYVMGIFPWPVILAMALGLVGGIVWERQPVI